MSTVHNPLLRRHYLQAMGISVWQRRSLPDTDVPAPGGGSEPAPAVIPHSREADVWNALQDAVRGCTRCGLHATRRQTVFGVGHPRAQWMFIGEAPGADEDAQGEPFVGRAGQLLNAMLFAIGLKREDVYIANVLKCRPPGNRDPQPEETTQCEPYLIRQIELIKPRLIVALGRHAAHSLLKTDLPLARLRGQTLSYQGIPLVVTYHPAYLLRTLTDKRKAWDDLCRARRLLETATAPNLMTGRTSEASRDSVTARGPRTRVPGVPPITPPIGENA
ncbi:MAG: uracil-DNA glycosylase [Pseudomonadota bacterium]